MPSKRVDASRAAGRAPGRAVAASAMGAFGAALLSAAPAAAQVSPHAGMMRFPDVSATEIVFVYANDLWLVPRDGGMARPLASPPGAELLPKFSPDGKTIAFVGNYEGDRDIYTISTEGGPAHRVTHHPTNELISDWTSDGKIIYSASGFAGLQRQTSIMTVSPEGGMPEMLPVPYGGNGAVSEDGVWLAYNPHTSDFRTWKRYRGGWAPDVWLFNLRDFTSKRATNWEGADTIPMWHKGTVYYLSDAGEEHRLNLWSFEPESGRTKQLTRFTEFDCKWPSMGPGPRGGGEVVFQNGTDLYLFDIGSGQSRTVEVTIPGDRPELRAQRTEVKDLVTGGDLSPTGKRALVSARGDLWTIPAKHGTARNLTRTSGVFERDPSWSPDGKWISYFSDESGEYELYVRPADGRGEARRLTTSAPNTSIWVGGLMWSPDSKHIAFTKHTGEIALVTVETGAYKTIDIDPYANEANLSWSHDNRWIAYDRAEDDQFNTSIWVYNVETGEKTRLTSPLFNDHNPVFDRKGDYLYFASERNFVNPQYAQGDTTFVYDNTGQLFAVGLRDDVKSPYLPKSDEEEAKKDDKEKDKDGAKEGEEKNGDGKDAEDAAPKSPIHGVWNGVAKGVKAFMPDGSDEMSFKMVFTVAGDGSITGYSVAMGQTESYDEVTFDEATGALYAHSTQNGIESTMKGTLKDTTIEGTWEIPAMNASGSFTATKSDEEPEASEDAESTKPREVVEIDFEGFEARAILLEPKPGRFFGLAVNDKNQLIYMRAKQGEPLSDLMLFDLKDEDKKEKTVASGIAGYAISADGKKVGLVRPGGWAIADASAGASSEPLKTDALVTMIDPREEWAQILADAWRIQRDWFYDPNMHGVDWPAIRTQYEAMLADASTREDVAFIVSEMISELNVGHAYYFGGDFEDEPSVSVGLLGCDFELGDGAYRIAKIYEGGPWDADARGPLSQPGIDVKVGDYVLEVNGVPVDTAKDVWAAFIDTVDRETVLTVSSEPVWDAEKAREVVVKPIASDSYLRYRAWIERNRQHVDYRTDGKVGYVHVPDTGINGQNNLYRQFFGQTAKPALIIDERWNGGGQIPTRFIELLNRPVTNYWARRDGKDWKWPPDSHTGPKAMLINGPSGSGGDAFPFYFRQAGLGKLIGTRTWGGLVGISGNPGLIDGAGVTAPTFAFYENDGTWGVEGHGVDPDIEVIDDPALMVDGGDPQLDAAIDQILKELETNAYNPPRRPAHPNRSGMGLPDSDK